MEKAVKILLLLGLVVANSLLVFLDRQNAINETLDQERKKLVQEYNLHRDLFDKRDNVKWEIKALQAQIDLLKEVRGIP